MFNILKQIKDRRLALGLKQHDISSRTGISRQQYQRLESKGNPRLDTLKHVAAALDAKVILVPNEQINTIAHLINTEQNSLTPLSHQEHAELVANPWKDWFGDDE